MLTTRKVRFFGIAIFLGLACYCIYAYLSYTAVLNELNQKPSESWYNDGEAYLVSKDDLHLHDTYYIVVSPSYFMISLLALLISSAIACLAIPSKLISIFQSKTKKLQNEME